MKLSFKYFFLFIIFDEIFNLLNPPPPVLHPTQDDYNEINIRMRPGFHHYQRSVTCAFFPPSKPKKKNQTEEGVSYRIYSFHKKKMSADKSKIRLQIFYEVLKDRCIWKVYISGRRFLHNIIVANIFLDV